LKGGESVKLEGTNEEKGKGKKLKEGQEEKKGG